MDSSKQTELLSQILTQLKNNARNNIGTNTQGYNVETITQMAEALKSVEQQAKSYAEQTKNMTGTISHAKEVLDEYGKGFGSIGLTFQMLNKASGDLLLKAAKMTGLTAIYKGIAKPVNQIRNSIKDYKKELAIADTNAKKLYASMNALAGISGAILGTIGSIGLGIINIGKSIITSVVGAFTSATSAVAKFAKFVVTLPIGIVNRASEIGAALRREIVEVLENANEKIKEMFDLSSNGRQGLKRLGVIAKDSLIDFQDVENSLVKLFGTGAEGASNMISEISKGMHEMGVFFDVFGDSVTKSQDSIEFFYRMRKGLALTAEDTKYFMSVALTEGTHYQTILTDVFEAVDESSKRFGVNRKLLSTNFLQLRKDIANFGHLSNIELTQTAAKATQMGIEIKDLISLMNKFDTYETAANSAALLAQSFGMNVDALALIRAENPLEIAHILRDSLMATGRTFDDLSFREKKLLSTHTGMSQEMLYMAMNFKNAGMSFEELQKKMKNQTPAARQLKAMRMINSSVVELRKTLEKKDFFTAFLDGLSQTIVYGTELGKTYQDISKNMQDFFKLGLLTKPERGQLDNILKPFNDILKEINAIFNVTSAKSIRNTILGFLEDVSKNVWTLWVEDCSIGLDKAKAKKREKLKQSIANVFSLEYVLKDKGFLGNLARQTGKIMGYIIKTFITFGPTLVKSLGKAILNAIEFVGKFFKGKLDIQHQKLWGEFFGFADCPAPVFNAFKDAVSEIYDYLFGYADKNGKKHRGFINNFISTFTEALSNSSEKGGLLDRAMQFTSEKFRDMFKFIGNAIVEGMSSASEALQKIGELIGRGLATTFGIDIEKTKPDAEPVKEPGLNRSVQITRQSGIPVAAADALINSAPTGTETALQTLAWSLKNTPKIGPFKLALDAVVKLAQEGDKNQAFNEKLADAVAQVNKTLATSNTDFRINPEFAEKIGEAWAARERAKTVGRVSMGTLGTGLGYTFGAPTGLGAIAFGTAGGAVGDFLAERLFAAQDWLQGLDEESLLKKFKETALSNYNKKLKRSKTLKSLSDEAKIKVSKGTLNPPGQNAALFKWDQTLNPFDTEPQDDSRLKPLYDLLRTQNPNMAREAGEIYGADLREINNYLLNTQDKQSQEYKNIENALLTLTNTLLDERVDENDTPININVDGATLFSFVIDKFKGATTNAALRRDQYSILSLRDGSGLNNVGQK